MNRQIRLIYPPALDFFSCSSSSLLLFLSSSPPLFLSSSLPLFLSSSLLTCSFSLFSSFLLLSFHFDSIAEISSTSLTAICCSLPLLFSLSVTLKECVHRICLIGPIFPGRLRLPLTIATTNQNQTKPTFALHLSSLSLLLTFLFQDRSPPELPRDVRSSSP